MDAKVINQMWAISLMVVGVATLVIAGSNIIGCELPDTAVRILGVIELIALPVLEYSTVRKVKSKA